MENNPKRYKINNLLYIKKIFAVECFLEYFKYAIIS